MKKFLWASLLTSPIALGLLSTGLIGVKAIWGFWISFASIIIFGFLIINFGSKLYRNDHEWVKRWVFNAINILILPKSVFLQICDENTTSPKGNGFSWWRCKTQSNFTVLPLWGKPGCYVSEILWDYESIP